MGDSLGGLGWNICSRVMWIRLPRKHVQYENGGPGEGAEEEPVKEAFIQSTNSD